ncbi:MAG TPA: SigE family RNA polymerase sigma factor [Micromonosporaceae bacterium]
MTEPPLLVDDFVGQAAPLRSRDPAGYAAASRVEDFAAFVRARTPALLRTAFLLTGDQHLAEDLVQSALTRTHQAWRRLHERGHAEAYTRRAMYHLQVSWWRRRRVPESLASEPPEPRSGNQDETTRVVSRLALLAALKRLTPAQRAVLVLRYFDDHTESEAADLLGVSVGTVKSQTSKALARLRAIAPDLAEHYLSANQAPDQTCEEASG